MALAPDHTIEDLGIGKDVGFKGGSNPYFSDQPSDQNIPAQGVGALGITRIRSSETAGRTIYVNPGENIQNAIETLRAEDNGGTIFLRAGTHLVEYEITGISKVNMVGAGRDSTILEFNSGATGLSYVGTSSAILENFILADFTLQNSNNAAGIDIDFSDFFRIENVRITSCDQVGIRILRSRNFTITNVLSDNNTGNGFVLTGDGTRSQSVFSLLNCRSGSNAIGYVISGSNQFIFSFVGCVADNNSGDGFDFGTGTTSIATVTGGRSDTNGGIGYDINNLDITFQGCIADSNTGDGFEVSQLNVRLIGTKASGNGTEYDINTSTIMMGCGIPFGLSTVPSDELSETDTQNSKIWGTFGGNTRTEKLSYRMLNSSGGELVLGDVVTFNAAADGDEITTTTTQGDDLVFGMILATTANGSYGPVLGIGYTVRLIVDGTTDIAIGDYLGTFTTAKIAMKAAAGDMAFAIALEAYTTDDSAGIINALLVTPRKI
ncbi:MAG: right-handed parallel beta-helix repeat-containing protein [Bacteroidetes bacterium]|nr:right-handed parallel beta-helix repeat-containing protein [Bacteroidota bacterium]